MCSNCTKPVFVNEARRGLSNTISTTRLACDKPNPHPQHRAGECGPTINLRIEVVDSGNEGTELAKQISDKIAGNKGDGDELINEPIVYKPNASSKLDVLRTARELRCHRG